MADGFTSTSTSTDTATTATQARRYWLGLVGKMVRYIYEPMTPTEPPEELRMYLVIPSTPTSRARGERVKAAVLEAAAAHQTPAKALASNGPLLEAVIEAARGAIGRVTTARELAAAFGLDVRLFSWRGAERYRHVYETPTLQPFGSSFGTSNGDAPTLSMSTSVEADAFVENVAWSVGALVCHWLGINPRDASASHLERQIGYSLAVRDEDVVGPVMLSAWWPYVEADGAITEASFEEASSALKAEYRAVAERIGARASAAMVKLVAESHCSFEDARRFARLACDRATGRSVLAHAAGSTSCSAGGAA